MRSLSIFRFALLLALAAPVISTGGAFAQEHAHEEHGDEAEHHDDDHDHEHAEGEHGDHDHEHGEHAHGDHDHAHGDHHHEHVTLAMIFADKKFLASLIAFAVLVFIMLKWVRPGIRAGLTTRRQEIETAVEEARKVKAEAEAKRQEFEERLARLDDEIETVKSEMRAAAEAERDRIVHEAEEKAALLRKDTQFQIDQRVKQMRSDLRAESVQLAIAAAEEILSQKTTGADQQRLANGYLDEVTEMLQSEVQA